MDFSGPGAEIHHERWDAELWDQNKIVVHSPRTEHSEERAYRQVPLYPELLPFLLDAAERADGIAGDLPRTCCLCMGGQLPKGGSEAPSAGDRRAFRKNAAATRRQPRKIAAMLQ